MSVSQLSDLLRYPRTSHLAGSRLQAGDSSAGQVAIGSLTCGTQVWEEKLDGSNTGVSFSPSGELQLQSRGHYLTGGGRERQFNLFKQWADCHIDWLFDVLGDRYIMYGEWCFAKHTVFYDRLPHYFFEFDVYDRVQNWFLSTRSRRHLLRQGAGDSPVVSVPVLSQERASSIAAVQRLIGPSLYKSAGWRETMQRVAQKHGIDPVRALRETDGSDLCEGLYLKLEDADKVLERYKFVRADFLQTITEAGSHWNSRTILPNQLAPGVDLFSVRREDAETHG